MATAHVDAIERSVQKTDQWLHALAAELQAADLVAAIERRGPGFRTCPCEKA